jgi:hypothetical protein
MNHRTETRITGPMEEHFPRGSWGYDWSWFVTAERTIGTLPMQRRRFFGPRAEERAEAWVRKMFA